MALQIRRGTEAERLTTTPLQGELLYTTDTKQLFIGDGSTVGGVSISEQSQDAIASLFSGSHTGIQFTYNDVANTLTATVTGGVDSLNTLTDVSISGEQVDDILKYGGVGIGWINGRVGLDTLSDATITLPANNQSLIYNAGSSQWVNGDVPFSSLSGVSLGVLSTGQVLAYNGTSWANHTVTLSDVSDIIVTTPQLGQVLKFDGLHWVNAADEVGSAGAGDLDSLTDVAITTPVAGQMIAYTGTAWVNSTVSLDSLSDVAITTPVNGDILQYTAGGWINTADTSLKSVFQDTSPTLGGNLNIGVHSINGDGSFTTSGEMSASKFNGPLKGNVTAIDNTVLVDSASKDATLSNVNATVANLGSTTANGQLNVHTTSSEHAIFNGLTAGGLSASWLRFETSRTSLSAPAAVQSGDFLSGMLLHGYNGTIQKLSVAFGGQADGAINSGNLPGAFVVLTKSSTGADHYMKFDSTGKLNAEVVSASIAIQQPVYADAAARDTAIPTPAAGMMVFLTSTGKFQGYTGSLWADLN